MNRLIALLVLAVLAVPLAPTATALTAVEVTVTPTPTQSVPGTRGSIDVTFENVGTVDLTQLRVELGTVSDDLEVDGTEWDLEALVEDQTTKLQIPFRVKEDASAGYHPLNLGLRYCTGGDCIRADHYALVTVRAVDSLVLEEVRPAVLEPGRLTQMTFVFHNAGPAGLSNLVASWSVEDDAILPTGAGNVLVVPRIDGGERVEVPVPVSTASDLPTGLYPLTLTATYRDDSGGVLTTTAVAGIQVGGAAQFGVSLQEWDGDELTLSISNVGVSPASAVEVRLLPGGPVDDGEGTAVQLGNLDPGDFTTALFRVERDPGAPADAPLQVRLAYTDSSGQRTVGEDQVLVGSKGLPQEGAGDGGGLGVGWVLFIVAVVAAGGAFAYTRWKHREREE